VSCLERKRFCHVSQVSGQPMQSPALPSVGAKKRGMTNASFCAFFLHGSQSAGTSRRDAAGRGCAGVGPAARDTQRGGGTLHHLPLPRPAAHVPPAQRIPETPGQKIRTPGNESLRPSAVVTVGWRSVCAASPGAACGRTAGESNSRCLSPGMCRGIGIWHLIRLRCRLGSAPSQALRDEHASETVK